jgi:hypothetical protein
MAVPEEINADMQAFGMGKEAVLGWSAKHTRTLHFCR